MSELIQTTPNASIRWQLLAGVSALALTTYIAASDLARAEDVDRPTVWIELGSQFSQLGNSQEAFAPPFLALTPSFFSSQPQFERPSQGSLDEAGEISFQPENSDWVVSASVRYGRSNASKHMHQQTYPSAYAKYRYHTFFVGTIKPRAAKFTDTTSKQSETHAIIDFQVGKDVGLGLFGGAGSAILDAGIRFAQFTSNSRTSIKMDPDWHFSHKYVTYPSFGITHSKIPLGQPYHTYRGDFQASRSFHGIGPSLSLKASASIIGNADDGSIALDWGMNAAALFGRQKASTHHQTTGLYHPPSGIFPNPNLISVYHRPATPNRIRSRSVVVPNVGGFAGLSFRYVNAKLSLGYRGDFFFGAIDGGIDARKTYNRNFYGPYASISIGLGG